MSEIIEIVQVRGETHLFSVKVFGREWGNEDFDEATAKVKAAELNSALSILISRARAEERERCANACPECAGSGRNPYYPTGDVQCRVCYWVRSLASTDAKKEKPNGSN